MKLHLGCGDIYLTDGYVNIDVRIDGYSFRAQDRPDIVEQNSTTEDNYYQKPYPGAGGFDGQCVADRFMDFKDLSYRDNSAEKILAVQCLEHLTPNEARRAVAEWYRVLEPGGILIVDVPDFEALAQKLLDELLEENRVYYYQMIFGSHKNSFASHKDGYSTFKLVLLLREAGFEKEQIIEMGNLFAHPYPSITIEARKA